MSEKHAIELAILAAQLREYRKRFPAKPITRLDGTEAFELSAEAYKYTEFIVEELLRIADETVNENANRP